MEVTDAVREGEGVRMMLECSPERGEYVLSERFGLQHERQVVTLPLGGAWAGYGGRMHLRAAGGEVFPCQRGQHGGPCLYALVSMAEGETLRLNLEAAAEGMEGGPASGGVSVRRTPEGLELGNGRICLRLPPEGREEPAGSLLRGVGGLPAAALRGVSGPAGGGCKSAVMRGRSFYETHHRLVGISTSILEEGEVRSVVEVRADFVGGGYHITRFTLDTWQPFTRIEEEFSLHEGAQVVFDLHGADLPDTAFILDATPAYSSVWLHWGIDRQIAALGAWSQQSQLALCDGYALRLPGDGGVIGFFCIDGGRWRGNRLNSLEAWVRRWRGDDPLTRRLVRPEAKADSMHGYECIPERDRGDCCGHLCVEGWLGQGRREWGLLFCPENEFVPKTGDDRGGAVSGGIGHFEDSLPRAQYENTQGLLRRLHIRHGVFPLQRQLDICCNWREQEVTEDIARQREALLRSPLLWAHLGKHAGEEQGCWRMGEIDWETQKRRMLEYLRVRVESFWYGAGIASTNPVSSRRIAPLMFLYEHLRAGGGEGGLTPAEAAQIRAWFSFLAGLMADPNYYPGWSAMLPADSSDSLDPTLMGMANQNFYTDVYTIPGTLGQIFTDHPRAQDWRAHFTAQLSRQMQVHVYPESGVWEESHTYFQHVLHTLLPLLLRRVRDGEAEETFFDRPVFRRMVRAILAQRTAPDQLYGGRRHIVPLGDHDGNPAAWAHIWAALAGGVAPYDKELAENLRWFATETGGAETLPPAAAAQPRELLPHDEHLAGLGVFLRARANGDETLLALRAGAAWGHHHDDEGSIWLYAFGRPLLADAACGEVQKSGRKFSAQGHSRWLPAQGSVRNYLFRFNRGAVIRSRLNAGLAFAESFIPSVLDPAGGRRALPLERPLRHWRTVVRLGAHCYLLFDHTAEAIASELHFHLTTKKVARAEDAPRADWEGEYPQGERLRIIPLWGISGGEVRGIDMPDSGDARFATTHLALSRMENQRTSALLLDASDGKRSQAAIVRQIADKQDGALCWQVQTNGGRFTLTREKGETWQIVDQSTLCEGRFVFPPSPCS